MPIVADFVFLCEGCIIATEVVECPVVPGASTPTPPLPPGWNGVDTGRILCPRCSQEPERASV